MKIYEETIIRNMKNLIKMGYVNSVNADDPKIGLYTPRSMMNPFSKRLPVTTFMKDTFFKRYQLFETESVDMDFLKGQQNVAPIIAKGVDTINIGREGFKTAQYSAPDIGLSMIYDFDLGKRRVPGELLYSGMSMEDRIAMMYILDYAMLDNMVIRREELMCCELLQTGKITLKEYSGDSKVPVRTDVVELDKNKLEVLTGDNEWSNPDTDIYGFLNDKAFEIRKTGYNAQILIMGVEAWKLFHKNKFMYDMLNNRRVNMGRYEPGIAEVIAGNGYSYLGTLSGAGLGNMRMYSYDAWYNDENNKLTSYIDPNIVIMAPVDIGQFLYGGIPLLDRSGKFVTHQSKRVAKITVNEESNVKKLKMYSKPIPLVFDVDCWKSIKVVS